jgi:hypothetical protein
MLANFQLSFLVSIAWCISLKTTMLVCTLLIHFAEITSQERGVEVTLSGIRSQGTILILAAL